MDRTEGVIRTEGLTKFYGSQLGVRDLNLLVEAGEVFGFLGPNGAGKTTTIRLLMDFIRPTEGRAVVFGIDTRKDPVEIHRRVGFLPGELAMYGRLTGEQLVEYFAAIREMSDLSHAHDIAERMELDLSLQIRAYSSGNRQKLGIVQAFMHRPELFIMDEPTNALDPLIQQEFYRMLREVTGEGATVFLSSHILPEVERIADRVGIIRRGTLVVVEDIETLRAKAVRRVELHFASVADASGFAALDPVRSASASDDGRVLRLEVEGSLDPVIKHAAQHEVLNIISNEADLEGVFLAYYEDENEAEIETMGADVHAF